MSGWGRHFGRRSCAEIVARVERVEGFLGEQEMAFLYRTALDGLPSNATVVEIGSFKGKSTILLGKGLKDGRGGKIYAIDPHVGSEEHKRDGKDIWTYDAFRQNVERFGVSDMITPIVDFSHNVVSAHSEIRDIDLLWIDGAHDYESVRKDYEQWKDRVRDGGWIVFHDTITGGPHQVVKESVLGRGELTGVGFVQSIFYGRVGSNGHIWDCVSRWAVGLVWSMYCFAATWRLHGARDHLAL